MITDDERRKRNAELKKREREENPEKVRMKYRKWSAENRERIRERIVVQKETQRQKTESEMSFLPKESRAARGLLDWTQADLAEASALGKSTIRNFELQHHSTTEANMQAMRTAFEKAGIIFEDGKFIGVKIKR